MTCNRYQMIFKHGKLLTCGDYQTKGFFLSELHTTVIEARTEITVVEMRRSGLMMLMNRNKQQ